MRFPILILSLIFFLHINPGYASSHEADNQDYLYGQLPDGLTYYIRSNHPGKGTVNFYLVEKAGSLNEEDNQSGLAHFLEHMAFKGTKHFPDRSLIDYLQGNGVMFGPDLNAVTSFDKTTLRIENVPAEYPLIDSCLLILRDWSGELLLEHDKIDAERAVITEEWRTTASSQKRIRSQLTKLLLPEGHPYAMKTPIGSMEVVNNFPYSDLEDFYHKWYRPELQAVIVEGDIDPGKVLETIQKLWDGKGSDKELPSFNFPKLPQSDHELVAIATDPEVNNTSIDIQFFQTENRPETDPYKADQLRLAEDMVASMIAGRLREKLRMANPPYKAPSAYTGTYNPAPAYPAFTIGAAFPSNLWREALQALVYEIKRVKELGFTKEELESQLKELTGTLNFLRNADASKINLSQQFADNFISGTPIITLPTRIKSLEDFINSVDIPQLNATADRMIHSGGENTAIIFRSNTKNQDIPQTEELLNTYKESFNCEVEEYKPMPVEIFSAELMEEKPEAGTVTAENELNTIPGVKVLYLSNGGRVYLLPSENKTGQLRLTAVSKGGFSVLPTESYPQYSVMNEVAQLGGLGQHSASEIKKILAGKQLNYRSGVDLLTEFFEGRAASDDKESLFQLLYLRFTSFPQDREAFKNWKDSYRQRILLERKSPFGQITDSISGLLYGKNNPVMTPLTPDSAETLDYDEMINLYAQRFANASDFDFIITGVQDTPELRDLIKTYIASLPGEKESMKENFDLSRMPLPLPFKGTIRDTIPMGSPKTTVMHTVNAQLEYSLKNRLTFLILQEILKDLYIKDIRDNQGGTYRINMNGDISRSPKDLLSLTINFDTNPDQAADLIEILNQGLKKVAENGTDINVMGGVKKNFISDYRNFSSTDDFKLNLMKDYLLFDTLESLDYIEIIDKINGEDIKSMAKVILEAPTVVDLIIDSVR